MRPTGVSLREAAIGAIGEATSEAEGVPAERLESTGVVVARGVEPTSGGRPLLPEVDLEAEGLCAEDHTGEAEADTAKIELRLRSQLTNRMGK